MIEQRDVRWVIEELTGREAEESEQAFVKQIIADAHDARAEHAAGKTRAISVDDLLSEIDS